MMRKLLAVFLFLGISASSYTSYGQGRTVTGKVTDAAAGLPVPGVSVTVQGSSVGTATDPEGNYSIKIPGNDAVLLFNFLGMQTVEETVGEREIINVALEEAASELEEVVVIGYGTAAKRDLTGSIASIDGSEVADLPSTNPVASLQGKVAGVQVTNSGRPGAEPDIRIRGTNTVNGVKPLYVVDGILNDNINYLNPADIASMEILKDPSSLAIFGVRGANGVIVITTKQAEAGELNFNFNSSVGFKNVADPMAMTDAAGFKMLYDEQLVNDGAPPFDYDLWTANTDWQDEIFQKGMLNYNNLSVSGASEKNKFYMGLGYTTEQGMIRHEQLERITLTLNDELQLTDNFKVGVNFSGYRSELPQERNVASAIRAAPIAPVFDEASGLYHTLPDFQRAQIWNPLVDVELRKNTAISRQYRAVGSVFGEIDFLRHFNFRATLLADYGFNHSRSYSPLIDVYNPDIPGEGIDHLVEVTSVSQNQDIYTKVQSDWLLTYKNSFSDHNLTVLAGWTSYYNSFEGTNGSRTQGEGAPIPNEPRFWYVDIGASDTQTGGGSAWERATLSFLSRVLYNYKYKYLLNLSFRRDGSSGFLEGPGRWQNFGSVGAAWVLSEEDFMKDGGTLNYLKLKGSWGMLGNQNTGDQYRYPAYPVLVAGNSAVFGDQVIPALEPEYIPDRDLHWEVVRAWEAGFELQALENRLSLEAVWYDKKTKDILVTVPGSLGARPGLSNVGRIANKGLELSASWTQQLGDDLSLSVNGNFTTIKNEVLGLKDEGHAIFNGISRTIAGYPIGYFYGYVSDGIYQTDTEIRQSPANTINEVKPGDIKYRDVNGDDVINQDDRTLIGNPTPDFTYGVGLSLSYHGFDLAADFTGVYGNEIFRNWNRNPFSQFNFQESMLDRWHGVGTSNWEPIISSGRPNNRLASSYYIEDGSFFRIRNVQLGYNFSQQALGKLGLKALRIYLNAQNLWTFTNSTGFTPEIGGSATSFGVDDGTYPIPAIYTLGVNLNF